MNGIRGSRVQGLLVAAALLVAIALIAPSLASATIVYRHRGDLWTMNDNGSGAHALVTAARMPGAGVWTIGGPDVLPGGNTIVFTGTTNANDDGPANGPPGGCGLNCSGTYKLRNGVLTRLTPAPVRCGAGQQWCTSFETEPRLTADGRVAFDSFITAWDYSCALFPCQWSFIDSQDTLDTRSVATGGSRTQWNSTSSLAINSLPTPDPADATKLVYADETFGNTDPCNPNPYYIEEGHRDGSGTHVVICDDAPFVSLAWVPDGSALIDVEAGTQPGIWAYDDSSATNTTKRFLWLLADPAAGQHGSFSTSITTARYMGPDKILFDQNGDLYTIPLTACARAATANAAGCTMANAHRLTHDGKSTEAVWTTTALSCVVPKITGLSVSAARSRLSAASCGLGTQHTAYSTRVKKGRVISQATRAGTILAAGSKVGVTVSKGKRHR